MRVKYGDGLLDLIHPVTKDMNMLNARPHAAKELKAKHEKKLADCDPDDEDCLEIYSGTYVGYDEGEAWWYGFIVGSQYSAESNFLDS